MAKNYIMETERWYNVVRDSNDGVMNCNNGKYSASNRKE